MINISAPAAILSSVTDLYSINDMNTLAIHAEFLPSAYEGKYKYLLF